MRLLPACFAIGGIAFTALANVPPNTPVVTEPGVGRIVNPADVHMETGLFSDPDAGDTHLCTDWEIWTVSPSQRVWATLCIGGVEEPVVPGVLVVVQDELPVELVEFGHRYPRLCLALTRPSIRRSTSWGIEYR